MALPRENVITLVFHLKAVKASFNREAVSISWYLSLTIDQNTI